MTAKNLIFWTLRLVAALIMLQTLYFKFTRHPESVHIFSMLGVEPWGRIMSGVFELIASVLILIPRSTFIGAALTSGIMLGAIASHLLVLGVEVEGDGGQLFIYACTVFAAGIILLVTHRGQYIRPRAI